MAWNPTANILAITALLSASCGGGGGGGEGEGTGVTFQLDAEQESVVTDGGNQHQIDIDVTPLGGFAESIELSIDSTPTGITAAIEPTTLKSGTARLTVDVSPSVPTGAHTVTINARSGGVSKTTAIVLHTLAAPRSSGLTLTLPSRIALRPGQSTACMLEIARQTGAVGSIELSIAPAQGAPTALFNTNPTPQDSSLLLLDAPASTAPGVYPVTVTGTVGANTGTANIHVEVIDSADAVDRWISRVEFAQSYFASDLALLEGKSALVRAHVLADVAGTPAPRIELVANDTNGELGRRDLTGPGTLPTGEQIDSLASSFTTELPESWVKTNLRLSITIDPDGNAPDRVASNDTADIDPTVAAGPDIEIVVVPLRIGGTTGAPADYSSATLARWPIDELTITTRAAYTITSTPSVSANGTGWSDVLTELAALRASDGSTAYYYGAVPLTYRSGVYGLGYVGFPVSVGADFSVSTMLHEIGHNFSLQHAPCGGPASPDGNYPYPGGICGRQGYDLATKRLYSAATRRDIMGYCGSTWISGYNYEKVRNRISPSLTIQQLVGGTPPQPEPLVTLSGWVASDGTVTFDPARRSIAILTPGEDATGSDLELRTTWNGLVDRHTIRAHCIGCGHSDPRGRRFTITLPDRGSLDAVEIWRDETRLFVEQRGANGDSAPNPVWSESNGTLRIEWDEDHYPSISVVHVGARRTTLGLKLGSGEAELDTTDIPAGGSFEFSFEAGLDGRCVCVARP